MALRTRSRSRCRWHRLVGGGGTASFTEYPIGSYTWNGQKFYPPFTDLCNYYKFGATYTPSLYSNTDLHRYDYSTMTDVEPTDKTRETWNYCSHVKRDLVSARHWFTAKRSTSQWMVEANRFSTPAALYESDLPASPSATQWHNWRAEAYAKLIPELEKSDFSAFNFLLELRELKGAVKLCTRGISAIASYWTNVLRNVASVSDLGKTPAELTLMYDFGLKPLVNDVAKLSLLLAKVREDVTAFNKRGEHKRVHHVKLPLVVSNTNAVNGAYRDYLIKMHTFRCQAELSYRIDSDALAKLSELDMISERFGFRATPGRIWNAIPFSFLIDWFVNIGECLASTEVDGMFRAVPTVTRYSESLTSEVWKISTIRVGDTVVNGYTHKHCRSEMYEDKLFPDAMYSLIGPYGSLPINYTVVRRYLRQPQSWEGTFGSPLSHVRIPALTFEYNVRKLRDGLSLARLRMNTPFKR